MAGFPDYGARTVDGDWYCQMPKVDIGMAQCN
jgi:hypothetical protein